MEEVVAGLIQSYGVTGLLIILLGLFIWDKWKHNKSIANNGEKIDELIKHFDHVNDNIQSTIDDVKEDITEIKEASATYKAKFDDVDNKIININEKFDTKLTLLDEKFIDHIKFLKEGLIAQPKLIVKELDTRKTQLMKAHNDHMRNMINVAPLLHETMKKYISKINCTHLFIGSFHNGTDSICGIPYYKFDIIAEKFSKNKVKSDAEFAPIYKGADMLRHDKLPFLLVEQKTLHYIIDKDKKSVLQDDDEIVYGRMIKRGIKQLAVTLMSDKFGNPQGFLACVRYDYETININELENCNKEIENIYIN